MKGKDYILGAAEGAGLLILGMIPEVSAVPLLVLLALVSCYKDKPWEIPSSVFTLNSVNSTQIFRIILGSAVKTLVVVLTVNLVSISPIL